MKGIQLITLCLIFSIYRCQDDDEATMIYAVGKKVFTKELGKTEDSKDLTNNDGGVSGLEIYDGYFYLSHTAGSEVSKIWRIRISPDSKRFSLRGSEWEEFKKFSQDDEEDITSMAVAAGHVYSGSNMGNFRSCWADLLPSCRNFFLTNSKAWPADAGIGDIEYNTGNHEIVAVSIADESRQLWNCSTGLAPACKEVNIVLKGWAKLHNAFEAFWIADAGLIRKCPYGVVSNEECLVFHNFTQPGYVNIGSSNKYLYARWESTGNSIWRCDPNTLNSCFKAFELNHDDVIGPFTFY